MPLQVEADATLHLPRILCLHGGGSNARIFRAQCRALKTRLNAHFRLVFADAPFLSQAGPCVRSVYEDWGPFRRWFRWTPDDPEINAAEAVTQIEHSLQKSMEDDDSKGATGEWVALLGFSQGAKMCASLLFHQQLVRELGQNLSLGTYKGSLNFRFGVLLAGRGPLVSLNPVITTPGLQDAGAMSLVDDSWYSKSDWERAHVLRIPTIHVHGMQDPGVQLHRRLLEEYCEEASTRMVVWNGDHRVPLKSWDVAAVVAQILDVSHQT